MALVTREGRMLQRPSGRARTCLQCDRLLLCTVSCMILIILCLFQIQRILDLTLEIFLNISKCTVRIVSSNGIVIGRFLYSTMSLIHFPKTRVWISVKFIQETIC